MSVFGFFFSFKQFKFMKNEQRINSIFFSFLCLILMFSACCSVWNRMNTKWLSRSARSRAPTGTTEHFIRVLGKKKESSFEMAHHGLWIIAETPTVLKITVFQIRNRLPKYDRSLQNKIVWMVLMLLQYPGSFGKSFKAH